MVADGRLINPADGPASSDHPRPGDVELGEAIDEADGIAGVAGINPADKPDMDVPNPDASGELSQLDLAGPRTHSF